MNSRLYTFTHYMLSSVQQGVQSLHATANLFVKYQEKSPQREALFDWACNDKTAILLNGGNSDDLALLVPIIEKTELPFAVFFEDWQSLRGVATSIAVVVPEVVWNAIVDDQSDDLIYLVGNQPISVYAPLGQFIEQLKSRGLAR